MMAKQIAQRLSRAEHIFETLRISHINGDMLRIKNDGGEFHVEVLGLSEIRGPAAVAQTLYRETDESREMRKKLAEERKLTPHVEATRVGKPSKRDRRQIGRLRGRE